MVKKMCESEGSVRASRLHPTTDNIPYKHTMPTWALRNAVALVKINQVCAQGPDCPAGPIFLTGQICFELNGRLRPHNSFPFPAAELSSDEVAGGDFKGEGQGHS